jgi:hypothetical protein
MQLRISGKRALLILAILALIFAGALYWALYPLYARGKEGLQSKPAPTDAAPNRSTE